MVCVFCATNNRVIVSGILSDLIFVVSGLN